MNFDKDKGVQQRNIPGIATSIQATLIIPFIEVNYLKFMYLNTDIKGVDSGA